MNKRQFLKTTLSASAAALAARFGVGSAFAADKYTVSLLLCPSGCGPTEGDTILMTQMIKSGSEVTLFPQETPGYVYNIREMVNEKNWKNTIFSTEDVLIQLAMKWGGTPELEEFLPKRVPIKFKLLYGETWWPIGKFFVTFNPDIKTIDDIKGKRLSIGSRTQTNWCMYPRILLKEAGITPDNTDIRHLIPATLTQQLIDGSTDVAITVFGMEPHKREWLIGGPLRQLEASGRPLRYIGMPKELLDITNKKYGTTFLHSTIPAGTLPKQTEPLSVGIARGYKAAHEEFSEEAAYHLIMNVAKMAPKLHDLHVLWKIWSPELMVAGLSDENVHPGAKRAYVELGWWDKTKDYSPVTYPS